MLKKLILAAILALVPLQAWATTRGDTFVDTAGTGLPSHTASGPNGGWVWSNADGTGSVATINASNQVKIVGAGVGNFLAATVGSNDQYAQIQVMAAADSFPITVRSSGNSSGSFYGARYNVANNHWEVFKNVSGTFTQIGSGVAAILTPGDTAKLQVIGTSITLFVNGTSTITGTDSSISTGVPGLEVRSSDGAIDPWVQNFQADQAAAGASLPPLRSLMGVGQ